MPLYRTISVGTTSTVIVPTTSVTGSRWVTVKNVGQQPVTIGNDVLGPGVDRNYFLSDTQTLNAVTSGGTTTVEVTDAQATQVGPRLIGAASDVVFESWVTGEAYPRERRLADGRVFRGGGTTSPEFSFDAAWGVIATGDPKLFANSLLTFSANRAYYMRVWGGAQTISKIGLHVGTSSGNVCVGVYRNTGSGRSARPDTRAATSGSVAAPTGTSYSEVSLTGSTTVYPGDWLAFAADNTSVTASSITINNSSMYDGIVHMQDTAFPLPATATPASTNNRAVWLVGVP